MEFVVIDDQAFHEALRIIWQVISKLTGMLALAPWA